MIDLDPLFWNAYLNQGKGNNQGYCCLEYLQKANDTKGQADFSIRKVHVSHSYINKKVAMPTPYTFLPQKIVSCSFR